jgi:hypothetical protein
MAGRKMHRDGEKAMRQTIKTTIQVTPDQYARLSALLAKRRAAGEKIDRSRLIAEILESELKRVIITIRAGKDPWTESAA